MSGCARWHNKSAGQRRQEGRSSPSAHRIEEDQQISANSERDLSPDVHNWALKAGVIPIEPALHIYLSPSSDFRGREFQPITSSISPDRRSAPIGQPTTTGPYTNISYGVSWSTRKPAWSVKGPEIYKALNSSPKVFTSIQMLVSHWFERNSKKIDSHPPESTESLEDREHLVSVKHLDLCCAKKNDYYKRRKSGERTIHDQRRERRNRERTTKLTEEDGIQQKANPVELKKRVTAVGRTHLMTNTSQCTFGRTQMRCDPSFQPTSSSVSQSEAHGDRSVRDLRKASGDRPLLSQQHSGYVATNQNLTSRCNTDRFILYNKSGVRTSTTGSGWRPGPHTTWCTISGRQFSRNFWEVGRACELASPQPGILNSTLAHPGLDRLSDRRKKMREVQTSNTAKSIIHPHGHEGLYLPANTKRIRRNSIAVSAVQYSRRNAEGKLVTGTSIEQLSNVFKQLHHAGYYSSLPVLTEQTFLPRK
ncbi:unnamed protein product [Calicophoron daubneyi]|uniref:Uncharacterized protein n=1 Tax=Calicophoron daubneyi TaxID=300641 RepID=A0AAV2TJ30_CALDB